MPYMVSQDNAEGFTMCFLEEMVMTPKYALIHAIRPGLKCLPEKMRGPDAEAMLLAIGLQESRLTHRHQIGGPAHGFFQFEKGGGVKGVLRHRSSAELIHTILRDLEIPATDAFEAILYNDTLAVVFARLLLWTDPHTLPCIDSDVDVTWEYYIRNWRPGKPHPATWPANYKAACSVVKENKGGDL
jgi:hypothetical protein